MLRKGHKTRHERNYVELGATCAAGSLQKENSVTVYSPSRRWKVCSPQSISGASQLRSPKRSQIDLSLDLHCSCQAKCASKNPCMRWVNELDCASIKGVNIVFSNHYGSLTASGRLGLCCSSCMEPFDVSLGCSFYWFGVWTQQLDNSLLDKRAQTSRCCVLVLVCAVLSPAGFRHGASSRWWGSIFRALVNAPHVFAKVCWKRQPATNINSPSSKRTMSFMFDFPADNWRNHCSVFLCRYSFLENSNIRVAIVLMRETTNPPSMFTHLLESLISHHHLL